MTTVYRFDSVMTPDGWIAPGWVEIDDGGGIAAVSDTAPAAGEVAHVTGHAVPGMPNLHSHAFQRAMAGLAERAGTGADSFWSWRETMYRFVARLTPDDLGAIAAQLYVEMLKAGYTAVGEFHYLHHGPDGTPYDDPAENSFRLIDAAERAGIGMTLLPVLYAAGGFGGAACDAGQRRFAMTVDDFLALVAGLHARWPGDATGDAAGDAAGDATGDAARDPELRIGIAPHSLRAVPPAALAAALDGLDAIDATAPVHIHIAEQLREVEDCLAWSGARPVDWLLDNAPVDGRWCLVHATHMTADEAGRAAASGAVAGLCPTTEANLGDGVFGLAGWRGAGRQGVGGRLGIGSDSHVSVSPVEELRWLEYGQRLAAHARNTAAAPGEATGAALWRAALSGGARALGRPLGAIAAGRRADLVVLDSDHPALVGRAGDAVLDSWLFSGNTTPVRDVMAGGRWVVKDGRHAAEEPIARAFRATIRGLL